VANDQLKEEIKLFTEILRPVWVSALGIGGGTVGLVLGDLSALRIIFAATGFAIVTGLAIVLQRLPRYIRGLISQLKE